MPEEEKYEFLKTIYGIIVNTGTRVRINFKGELYHKEGCIVDRYGYYLRVVFDGDKNVSIVYPLDLDFFINNQWVLGIETRHSSQD